MDTEPVKVQTKVFFYTSLKYISNFIVFSLITIYILYIKKICTIEIDAKVIT